MGDYTKLSFEQVLEVLNLYDLPEPTDIVPQSLGISNSNYQICFKSLDPILLKVSNDKNIHDLGKEISILDYLHSNNFEFSLVPLPTQSGELVYSHQGIHGVAFPFINATPPQINKPTIKELAKAMAQLHLIKPDPSLRSHTEVGFDLELIENFLQDANCPEDFKVSFEQRFSEGLINELKSLTQDDAIIHGDLYYDNSLFDNSGLVKVIDFEQAGIGYSLLDIGISISGSCLVNNLLNQQLIDCYVDSYESIRKIKNIGYLNHFIHLGLYSIALWRIKRFYTGSLDLEKRDSYKELINISRKF